MKKTILLFLLLFVGTQTVVADLHPDEKDVIVEFYHLNKDALDKLKGWKEAFRPNSPLPIGTGKARNAKPGEIIPEGLTLEVRSVSGSNDGIVKISLPNKGIRKLPERFNGFLFLRELDLSGNTLEKIPDAMGRIVPLSRIDLSNNRHQDSCAYGLPGIKGKIPSSFGLLRNLSYLDVSRNCLTKIETTHNTSTAETDIFKGSSRTLKYLNLSDNFIDNAGAASGAMNKYFASFGANHIDVSCNRIKNAESDIKYARTTAIIMTRKSCPLSTQGNTFDPKPQSGNKFVYNAPSLKAFYHVEKPTKTNPYYHKVPFKIRQVIAKYISRFSEKLKRKTKAQIIQIKKKELERIKTIVKKYEPLSQADLHMLKYLFEELKNI